MNHILLPTLPAAAPLQEAVLFAFDRQALPFQDHVQLHLIPGQNPQVVLEHGPAGAHDEVLLYYGTVIRLDDTFHMWYNGNYGPVTSHICLERDHCVLCYARSRDGVHWEKPDLGLVEFNGSRHNNIVDFPAGNLWSTAAVLHDPADPDPARRFKSAYEARVEGRMRFCVAFSADGLHWLPSQLNPVGPFLEMTGVTRWRGLYYVNGQPGFNAHSPLPARRLATFVSADFEHWSPCGALGLDRAADRFGPSAEADQHQYEEIHLGAALWNRDNVILGIYGQWHGHPSGDRRLLAMDLGLAISHDGIAFHEPIRDFRFVPAREQPGSPLGLGPALMQGQGMENQGERTLYWYSLWRGGEGSGVRLVSWERDRLGYLQAFTPQSPRVISCPFQVIDGPARVYVNAGGLGPHSRLRINLLDEAFRPIPHYSGTAAAEIGADGLRVPVQWPAGSTLPASEGRLRLDIQFAGLRPEDISLYALYIAGEG